MEMYAFDGPDFHFHTTSLEDGELILRALSYLLGIDEDEYTATKVEVSLD